MGVNSEKVWGQAEALNMNIGLTYYWGGDIDWNSGSTVRPTFPGLLGMDEDEAVVMALDYNEETNQTLYMRLSNFTRTASTMDTQTETTVSDILQSDAVTASTHTMQLTENGSGKMLVIQWEAQSEAQAKADAAEIIIADQADSDIRYPITLLDNSKEANDPENAAANANLSYNEESKTAYLAVSFTDDLVYDTTWTIYTPEGAQLVVYDVAPLPKLTAQSAEVSGNQVTVELDGTQLESFTELTVFAEGKNTGESYLLGGAEAPFAGESRQLTLTLPDHMVSDSYTLRIAAKDSDEKYYSEASVDITYVNANQPDAPSITGAQSAGDYRAAITLADAQVDGFQFTAYDPDGRAVSGMTNVMLYKNGTSVSYNDNGTIAASEDNTLADEFIIGGQYIYTDSEGETVVTGLSAGTYTIEIRGWNRTEGGTALVSEPTSITVTVPEPVKTQISVSAVPAVGSQVTDTITSGDGASTYSLMRCNSSDVLIQLRSETESFTGKWRLDGGYLENSTGQITDLTKSVSVTLSGLDDGTHVLSFIGENEYGDAVSATCRFTVDTQGPRLMLAEPVNGSLFDYWTGTLTVSGVTDEGARLIVVDNTTVETVCDGVTVSVDETGRFTQEIVLDPSILSHDLTISVRDSLGNETAKDVSVVSNGLGSIEKLLICTGGKDVTNTKLTAGGTYPLSLMAKLRTPANESGELYVQINEAGMVDWSETVAEGEIQISDSASGITLTTSSDAEGMITARFLISDEGFYPVSAAFGYTGEQILDLDSAYTQIVAADQLYTGTERTTEVEVWYKGVKLTEGTDYQLSAYTNNVNVTTDGSKAQVEITGIGGYNGTIFGYFDISYLELDDSWITLSGTKGNNDFYVSSVSVIPDEGYEILVDGIPAQILWNTDGTFSQSFQLRRISDGAITDITACQASIDLTAPSGNLQLDQTFWSKFLHVVSFGIYKTESLAATVTAEDANGIEKIEFTIASEGFSSITELEAAGLTWKTYSNILKPTIQENKNQVIYVRITDKAGNVSYLSSDGLHIDTLAPQITVKVDQTSLSNSGFSFTITSNEAGKYYYAVVTADSEVPTQDDLLAQNVENAIVGFGMIQANQVGLPIRIDVSGLESETAYMIYVMAEDTVVMLDGSAAANMSEIVEVLTATKVICDGIHDCPSLAFSDLDTTLWYHLYTDFVIEEQLMQGYPDMTFDPDGELSRAMLVQILYNLEGQPAVTGTDSYTDTEDDAWYSDAIVWATNNGIVNGYGGGLYGPNDPVTREQMATIFYRYSGCKGYSLVQGCYASFADAGQVSQYAQDAMCWAVGNGLIVGDNNNMLYPKNNSTRAQIAVIMRRFVENIAM